MDVARLDLAHAESACLLSCQTGGVRLLDESVHPAAAEIYAGLPGLRADRSAHAVYEAVRPHPDLPLRWASFPRIGH